MKDNSFAYVMERADKKGTLAANLERSPLKDMAVWSNVNQLAAVKHAKALANRQEPYPRRDLKDSLCNDDNFIEAHIFGSFGVEDIEEIRLPNNFVTEMIFLQNLPDGTVLGGYEQISLNQYEESIIRIRENGLRIAIV